MRLRATTLGPLVAEGHDQFRVAADRRVQLMARALRLGFLDTEVLEADGDEDVAT